MTLDDQEWKEHIAMLKESKQAVQGSCSTDCDRLEEIRMAIGCELPSYNPYDPGTVEWHIFSLRKRAEMYSITTLSDNAWDIGTVSGVLQGIELTPTLLPNQKEAIASARNAIKRIEDRNKASIEALISRPVTDNLPKVNV